MNRFFTKKTLVETLYSKNFSSDSYLSELEKNYQTLNDEYRNEFYFKSILFNKLVLGKYSLNTSAAFSEIVIDNSKADFILINHHDGFVYEIKTDLDNLDRLIYQLNDYYKVFSTVYVVTTERNYYPVYKQLKELCPYVGIMVLTKRKHLSVRKKAIIDSRSLNHESLFKLLRKKEYETILLKKFGTLPVAKPVYYYRASLLQFRQIDVMEAQNLVFEQLNDRVETTEMGMLEKLPESIRWLVYSGKFSKQQLYEIFEKLN
ncbi:sce7726 family protein [Cohnella yongneupensis]|uniref:Sce7726 family protein n=1 Tax=Cohnella yongneupensis TaxID=425006 RepID=A0ABW0QZJ4_9BACL